MTTGRGARGERRPRAPRGRTALWFALVAVMAIAVAIALARRAHDGSRASPTPTTTAAVHRLLIREGLRREDVAKLLDAQTHISGAQYLALTGPGRRGQLLARTKRPTSLEGFLFPATYDVTDATTAADLVNMQLRAFRDNTAGIPYRYARTRNLTRYDVLTIASMIEREVQVPGERPIVAGVIYNRLHAHMRLDIDATVQYAIGSWRPLTPADLGIGSPYNTRRFPGLPPGPIASPGAGSILAAAKPAHHRFLYYVARNDGTGRHYFATTPAQFAQDVALSRKHAGG